MAHRGIRTAALAAAITAFIGLPASASATSTTSTSAGSTARSAAGTASSIASNAISIALGGKGSLAGTSCTSNPAERVWQAFLNWGDKADYWLAPGGDFESGAAGWSLTNARVIRGNDGRDVVDGKRSLAIGMGLVSLGSTAVTPPFCITSEHPTFRYMLKANGTVGLLSTFIRYTAADGSTQEQEVISKTATTLLPGQWKPSDLQPLATRLPMKKLGGVAKVQLVFRVPLAAVGAGYQIDNVLVDPYRVR